MKKFLLIVACACLVSCDSYSERIVGPYIAIAIDEPSNMSISYDLGGGSSIGKIDAEVVAVGFNDKFIIAKQRPLSDPSKVNYFYLEMAKDSKYANPSKSLTGPLSEKDFMESKSRLGLPDFTRTFR